MDQEFDLAPGKNPTTVRQTAAAAISLPKPLHLAQMVIKGHATEPTVLGILFDGVARSMFFCEADGWAEYLLDSDLVKELNATWLTVVSDDTPQAWTLTFDEVGYGPHIRNYRALFFECEVADSGTAVTQAFVGQGDRDGQFVPVACIGGQTTGVAAANARWAFNRVGDYQVTVEVGDNPASKMSYKQAPPLPPSANLTLTPTVSGAATYAVLVVYY